MISRERSIESATMPTWALSQRKIRRISFASRERRYESCADCSEMAVGSMYTVSFVALLRCTEPCNSPRWSLATGKT